MAHLGFGRFSVHHQRNDVSRHLVIGRGLFAERLQEKAESYQRRSVGDLFDKQIGHAHARKDRQKKGRPRAALSFGENNEEATALGSKQGPSRFQESNLTPGPH